MKDEFTRELKIAYINKLKSMAADSNEIIVEDNMVMHVMNLEEEFGIGDDLNILVTFFREEFTVTITNLGVSKNKRKMLEILHMKNQHKMYGKYFMLDSGDIWFQSLAWIPEKKNDVSSILHISVQMFKELADDYDEIKESTKPCIGDLLEKYRKYFGKIEARQMEELRILLEGYEGKSEDELREIVIKMNRYPMNLFSEIREKVDELLSCKVKERKKIEIEEMINGYEEKSEEELLELIERLERDYPDDFVEEVKATLKKCRDDKITARRIGEIEKIVEGYEDKSEDELKKILKKLDKYPKKLVGDLKTKIQICYNQKVELSIKTEIEVLVGDYENKSEKELLEIEKQLSAYPEQYVEDLRKSIHICHERKMETRIQKEIDLLISNYMDKSEEELLELVKQLKAYPEQYAAEAKENLQNCYNKKVDSRNYAEIEALISDYEDRTEEELLELQSKLKSYATKYTVTYSKRLEECYNNKVKARLENEIEKLTIGYEEKTENELKTILEKLLDYPADLVNEVQKSVKTCFTNKVLVRELGEVAELLKGYEEKSEQELMKILKQLERYSEEVAGDSYQNVKSLYEKKEKERLTNEVKSLLERFEEKTEEELKQILDRLEQYPKQIESTRRKKVKNFYGEKVKNRLDVEVHNLTKGYKNMSEPELFKLLDVLKEYPKEIAEKSVTLIQTQYEELLTKRWEKKKIPFDLLGIVMWIFCIWHVLGIFVAIGFWGKVTSLMMALVSCPRIKIDSKDIDVQIGNRKKRLLIAAIGIFFIIILFW